MRKLTLKKLRYLIKDEAKAVKEYKGYGLYNLASDEQRHHDFLEGLLKKRR